MGREQERPLSTQLPISAGVVGRYHILLPGKGPEVKDQEASRDVSRPVGQEDDKAGSGGILSGAKLTVCSGRKLKGWPKAPNQACPLTQLYRLPRGKEELWGEVAYTELGLANFRTKDLLRRTKFSSRKERRLRNDGKDWAGDQVPIWT